MLYLLSMKNYTDYNNLWDILLGNWDCFPFTVKDLPALVLFCLPPAEFTGPHSALQYVQSSLCAVVH